MSFSPRSLLAWIAVAIVGGEPLGRRGATELPPATPGEAGPDDLPAERDVRRD